MKNRVVWGRERYKILPPQFSLFFTRVMVILTRTALTRPAGGKGGGGEGDSVILRDASKARARFWSPECARARKDILSRAAYPPSKEISPLSFFPFFSVSRESQMTHIRRITVPRVPGAPGSADFRRKKSIRRRSRPSNPTSYAKCRSDKNISYT